MIKKILKRTWFYIALAISLFIVLFFISNPKSYWNKSIILVNIVYILFAITLLVLLYKTLKHYEKRSELIKSKLKYIFYITSVLSMILFGAYFTVFIECYVVPKPSHCEYIDMYGYPIEKEFSFDTCNVELIDKKFNESNQLIEMTLKYKTRSEFLDGWILVREYQNERLVKSTFNITTTDYSDSIYFWNDYNDKYLSIPLSNDVKRVYDYSYTENSYEILRTTYSQYGDFIVASESFGFRYEFFDDRIEKYLLRGQNFLMEEENISDVNFQENYIQFQLNLSGKDFRYKGITRDDILDDISQMYHFVDGSRDEFYDRLCESYSLITDSNHEYFGYYLGYTNFDELIYFKDILYPTSIYGDKDNSINSYGMLEFNYHEGYIESINISSFQGTHKSEFEYFRKDNKVIYIDEFFDGKLVQRHVINDWGVIKQVETYFVENYGPGFKDESDNYGYYNSNYTPILKEIRDFINYRDYKFIIEPVKIISYMQKEG
ncbi:hypothetical protein KHQ81_07775 [Mycoplasmatota bacterium]|nr:hypothetical protein KHQ81_07775 [Mycoplasmatota bacterium]